MSVFLTPRAEAVFRRHLLPARGSVGPAGLPEAPAAAASAFRTNREAIESSGEQVTQRIAGIAGVGPGDCAPDPGASSTRRRARSSRTTISTTADSGRRRSSRRASFIQLLLREYRRTGDLEVSQVARTSLDAMAAGGIYDHLGGGFHRYSTDERWLVPALREDALRQRAPRRSPISRRTRRRATRTTPASRARRSTTSCAR